MEHGEKSVMGGVRFSLSSTVIEQDKIWFCSSASLDAILWCSQSVLKYCINSIFFPSSLLIFPSWSFAIIFSHTTRKVNQWSSYWVIRVGTKGLQDKDNCTKHLPKRGLTVSNCLWQNCQSSAVVKRYPPMSWQLVQQLGHCYGCPLSLLKLLPRIHFLTLFFFFQIYLS